MTRPVVWTIAGSDCSGGAGIQADLLTIRDLGADAGTVITTVTAQNANRVSAVEPVGADTFVSQLNALLETMVPSAIKIGLVSTSQQVSLLIDFLDRLQKQHTVPVIFDPVCLASNGDPLSTDINPQRLRLLMSRVDLVTPNLSELSYLTDLPVDTIEQIQSACRDLLQTGVASVLAKGGHSKNQESVTDVWTDGHQWAAFTSQRIKTEHEHGTGCTLSSAIASAKANNYDWLDAITLAKAYVQQGLRQAQPIGRQSGAVAHNGWPSDELDFPTTRWLDDPLLSQNLNFPSCNTLQLGFYPVVSDLDLLHRLLQLGVKTIQLRIKDRTDKLSEHIQRAVALGKQFNARLFINDHWQLAIKHGAYGVHLGQEDLLEADLASVATAGLCLGISTHGYFELQRAKQIGPSYIALGHIFPTTTKDMPSRPQGLERLQRYQQLCSQLPTVAIGGIDLARAQQVLACGVGSVAVVRAVTEAENLSQVVEQFFQLTGEQLLEAVHADPA